MKDFFTQTVVTTLILKNQEMQLKVVLLAFLWSFCFVEVARSQPIEDENEDSSKECKTHFYRQYLQLCLDETQVRKTLKSMNTYEQILYLTLRIQGLPQTLYEVTSEQRRGSLASLLQEHKRFVITSYKNINPI